MVGGRTAHLAAVSADVMQAFAGVGSATAGVGSLGLAVGSSSLSRPSAGVLAARPASPCLGVSRDLLDATDYITGAVTSLVKELHSGRNDNGNWNDNGATCLIGCLIASQACVSGQIASFITSSLILSWLITQLFHKSFLPERLHCLRTRTRTGSSVVSCLQDFQQSHD